MSQILELVLFAGLAAVVLYQLYAVLGRRFDDGPPVERAPLPAPGPVSERRKLIPAEAQNGVGIAAIKAADPGFDVSKFLKGARKAYEMIVAAHARGDVEALKPLLNADVLAAFEADIAARKAEGALQEIEFVSAARAEIDEARLDAGVARVSVRLRAEIRAGADAETEETDELWTFERVTSSNDPNWRLSQVSEPATPEV